MTNDKMKNNCLMLVYFSCKLKILAILNKEKKVFFSNGEILYYIRWNHLGEPTKKLNVGV